MKKNKTKGPSKEDLKRDVLELNAQLSSSYHFADAELDKFCDLMGSGVLLQLSTLGNRKVLHPVVILDGLSKETIEAIRKDILRSYELATAFKPKGARAKP